MPHKRNPNLGGKRPGAGKPPGNALITALEVAKPSETKQFELTPSQEIAIVMLSRGCSDTKVALHLDVHRNTVHDWKLLPDFQAALSTELERVKNDGRTAYDPMVKPSLAVFDEVLEQRDDLSLAYKAAANVLDWKFGKPEIKEGTKVADRIEVHFHFQDDKPPPPAIEGEFKEVDS